MKKVSISLFAVLAIVLAVSSAFTTKTKTLDPNKWEQFGVTTVAPTAPVSTAYAARIADDFNIIFSVQKTSINTQITSFNGSHQAQVACADDSEKMCAALVSYVNTSATDLTLVDSKPGDYSLN